MSTQGVTDCQQSRKESVNLFESLCPTSFSDSRQEVQVTEPVVTNAITIDLATAGSVQMQVKNEPAHTVHDLVDAYEKIWTIFDRTNQIVNELSEVANVIGFKSPWDSEECRADLIHRGALQKVFERFQKIGIEPGTKLNLASEVKFAFGDDYMDQLEEQRRVMNSDVAKAYRADLKIFCDRMREHYPDGGKTLAMKQAADHLFKEWRLGANPFKIENGKTIICNNVWTQKKDYGLFKGKRVYTGGTIENMRQIARALAVFFEWAQTQDVRIEMAMIAAVGHDYQYEWLATSNTKHIIVPGEVELRTFYEEWKWSFSEAVAKQLREFIAENVSEEVVKNFSR